MNLLPWTLLASICLTAAPSHRRNWDLRQYTWLKLERQEAGAGPSAHPAVIAPAALKGMLAALVLTDGQDREPLLTGEEVARLAGPMAEALSLADPAEDLCVFTTTKRGEGFMAPHLTVTGRFFVLDGQLNVIIQETRLDYEGRDRAHGGPPMPDYGFRAKPGPAVISAPGAGQVRRDWVRFTLDAAPKAAPGAAAPVAAPVPAPAAPAPRTSAEERLKALKHLRDENLLTEEEYQKKRQEILKDL